MVSIVLHGNAQTLINIRAEDAWQLAINPLKTSPEYTLAGVYGKCVL